MWSDANKLIDESEFYFRAVVISLAVLSFGRFLMIVFFLGTYIVLYSKKVKVKIVNLFRASWRSFCEALSYCNLFEYQVHTFAISNGTKQGGVLSLYLFTRYIWYLLCDISGTPIGGLAVNIIAYADDIILLAPSWHSLQMLIRRLEKCCSLFDLVCNTKKIVCMVFTPHDKPKIVSYSFPEFTLNGQPLKYVSEFCY